MTTGTTELLALQKLLAGRYAIERPLGRGGMGFVFLARDLTLERPVAIKLLAPALGRQPRYRERFLREARAAARLSHPHIVPVHAVEAHGEMVCFIMGFVDGETLGQRIIRAGPLSDGDALRLTREVAWALGHAHAVGIIHRDIKPDNILLERHTGRALVADFGIAAVGSAAVGSAEGELAGERLGTPAHMSPEQAAGEAIDGRSDLYSLGSTAYFAVTARLPFDGTAGEMMRARLTRPAPSVTSLRPDLPPSFARAIDSCLAQEPVNRPANAEALLELLAETRPALAEAPLPVMSYVREAGQVSADVGATFVAGTFALMIYALAFRNDQFAAIAFYPIAALLFGVGLTRLGELVLHTRTLLSQGYSHDAVRPAVELELRREAAERSLAAATQPRQLTDRPAVMAALGAAKTALFIWLATRGIDTLTLIGVAGAVLIPTATLRQIWRKTGRAGGWWARLLQGRLGKLLFKVARVGQPADALPAPDAPTEIFLGDAAMRLFRALPESRRRELAELPTVVAKLQADALERTEPTQDGRSDVLLALENIRLDLLRLQAGEVQADQLTRDLDQARRLGEAIDQAIRR